MRTLRDFLDNLEDGDCNRRIKRISIEFNPPDDDVEGEDEIDEDDAEDLDDECDLDDEDDVESDDEDLDE
jgi:hypothetical protein